MLFIIYFSFFLCGLNGGYGDCTSKKEISIKTNKIMQNKANFQKAKNYYKFFNNSNYEQKTTNYELIKTNPIKAKFISR